MIIRIVPTSGTLKGETKWIEDLRKNQNYPENSSADIYEDREESNKIWRDLLSLNSSEQPPDTWMWIYNAWNIFNSIIMLEHLRLI